MGESNWRPSRHTLESLRTTARKGAARSAILNRSEKLLAPAVAIFAWRKRRQPAMIISMTPRTRRALPVVALLALAGCGGSVEGSPDEAGYDGSDIRDATSEVIETGDSADATNLFGETGPTDATLPPRPDGSLETGGPPPYDGSYFPDALCGPSTCPEGCCSSIGECIWPESNSACGDHGEPCVACVGEGSYCAGFGCATTQWTCGPSNCGGCCIGNVSSGDEPNTQCFPGTEGEFCGHGGAGCGICSPGETCFAIGFDAGGFCQANNGCTPANCTGCCLGNVCAQGDQAVACGYGGEACKSCGDGGVCQSGNCACGPPFFPPCGDD